MENPDLMQNALQQLQYLRAKLKSMKDAKTEAIAIVGMGCRFPGGVDSPESLWQLLRNGINGITEIPTDRWDIEKYYHPEPGVPGKMYTRYGGFIGQLREFDADFFGIAPREAISIDPQQRLLLEIAWESLENAGIVPEQLASNLTGVFIGISSNDYSSYLLNRPVEDIDAYLATGNSHSTAAGRLSYILGLVGPSLAVDTACSSSLVAVHLACQSLRNRECDIALVGGVNRILSPEFTINFSQARMLAADGHCKTFDATADGFVRSEGCGMIVVQRLSDALASGRRILAVIKGSAVNQDGRSGGLTVPNGPSQQSVIRQALANSGLTTADISYIEAHGTGTSLGDPIEVGALEAVFCDSHTINQPLLVGSLKTNIGHLEAAAGIAGLMKVVLALQHQEIPPHLHFSQPNPYINWENLPISIPTVATPWNSESNRFAGVSSFGFSGTNVHVILGEAPQISTPEASLIERPLNILTLSAKTPTALQDFARRFSDYFSLNPSSTSLWGDICFSANTGRSQFEHRLALVADSLSSACQQLNYFVDGNTTDLVISQVKSQSYSTQSHPKIAFLFTGQGSQYFNMGLELYSSARVFRETVDYCCEFLFVQFGFDLRGIIYGDINSQLNQTVYTQPALFVIEYALCQLWLSWGVTPSLLMGHSVGEYVAACIAGVFSLEDGLKLIATRARLMQELPQGKMVAVAASLSQIQDLIFPFSQQLSIAAINSPSNTVISGETSAIEQVVAILVTQGIQTTPLSVSHAFHSPMMLGMLEEFERVARSITFYSPKYSIVSNVTGNLINAEIATPEYWCRHITQTVRFLDGVSTLLKQGCGVFLEIGAKPILLSMARSVVSNESNYTWLPSLRAGQENWQIILKSFATLYGLGVQIDWEGFDQGYNRQLIDLPNYPFQRQRFWVDVNAERNLQPVINKLDVKLDIHPLLGQQLHLAKSSYLYFQHQSNNYPAYLQEHRVFTYVILPGAAYVEMALAAGKQLFPYKIIHLEEISFLQPCEITPDLPKVVQFILTEKENFQQKFEIVSSPLENSWIVHATGKVRILEEDINVNINNKIFDFVEKQSRYTQITDIADFYQNLQTVGIDYGETFQAIIQLWYGDNQALAEICLPKAEDESSSYEFHPILLDACLQTIAAIFYNQPTPSVYLPIGLDSLKIWGSVPDKIWSWVELRQDEKLSSIIVADIQILTPEGKIIASLNGLQLKAVQPQSSLIPSSDWQQWLYEIEWRNQAHVNLLVGEEFVLPSPEIISQRLAPKFSELLAEPDIQAYAELLPQLENLSLAYVVKALEELGLFLQIGEKFSQQQFITEARVVRSHRQLCTYLLSMLSSLGILQYKDELWSVQKSPNFGQAEIQQVQLQTRYALAITELKLLERCASHLVDVLQGRCEPLQILFPNGDFTSLSQLYQNSPGAKVMNTLVQQAVIIALEKLTTKELRTRRKKAIRILEIGGGTGGTTANLLPQLASYSVEYVFTDISPLFLAKAKEQFSNYSFVSYKSLNIEQSISSQGFTHNSFDIIIAANVLHATQNLSQTVNNVKSLLTNKGLLVLLEGTRPSGWLDLIFGLTEGWWCFQDKDLRPEHPLISAQQWQNLLEIHGFTSVKVISPDCELPESLAQQAVIVAQLEKQIEEIEEHQINPWLIITENQKFAEAITSNKSKQQSRSYYLNNLDNISGFLQETSSESIEHVIYICNSSNPENHLIPQSSYQQCTHLLNLVQALIQQKHYPTNLWIVTQGATDSTSTTTGLIQAPLWGIGKVIRLEHPELNCRCVDLEPTVPLLQQIDTLLAEINHPSKEDQIALHATVRKIARLVRSTNSQITTPDEPYRLTITQPGSLDSLKWQSAKRRQPQGLEVEIRVYATGLNFIDVLDSLGILPFERNWFGVECAGEIVAVGKDVTQFAVGDYVIALAPDSFSQYTITNANLVVAKPKQLSFESAATIPANFITAEYALHEVAKIQRGERILIHAAASGTGMAALQIAQQAGLEIFATASPGKWDKLRALGVQHIFNSRTLDFTTQILEVTNGEGVDIVFNSLSGEFIPASLQVLQSNGRFIEIGKRGVWNAQQVFQVKPQVAYHLVDLMSVAQQIPERVQFLFNRLMKKFEKGELQPSPQNTFTTNNVIIAFRMMQKAQHTGKIVITHQPNPSSSLNSGSLHSGELNLLDSIHPEATYLITGGMGGLGLEVADFLAQKGAKYLVLVGRTIPNAIQTQIQVLQSTGVTVTCIAADVTEAEQLQRVLKTIKENYPPLRGVIHGAGVLDDGVLQQLNSERLEKVMAAKVAGAWNLHNMTQDITLDYFIMFSSAASLLGSPGQANHVAANTFLDALAQYRHSQNLPALSINWGVWSDIGAAAKRQVENKMSLRGIGSITPAKGIEVLEYLLTQSTTQAKIQVGVIPINWSELLTQGISSNFFADFYTQSSEVQEISPLMQQLASLGINERQIMLSNYLQSEVGKVLGLPSSRLPDTQVGFFDMGMDSLMMVELRSQVERNLNLKIASTALFEHPNIHALAQYIAAEVLPVNKNIEKLELPATDKSLSKQEVAASIAEELAALEALLS